jgi:hypothetical protein
MKLLKRVFPTAVAVAMCLPSLALADVNYVWSFGGGTDTVSGYGTLTAALVPSIPGAYMITGGSGTVTISNVTYDVTIMTIADSTGNAGLCSSVWGGWASWMPATEQCGTVAEPPLAGGADYPYDTLIYPGAQPTNSVLDAWGIALYNAAGPAPDTYFSLSGAGSSGNSLPDYFEWEDTTNQPYVQLANPFVLTPEPGFYGLLALGFSGLMIVLRRQKAV